MTAVYIGSGWVACSLVVGAWYAATVRRLNRRSRRRGGYVKPPASLLTNPPDVGTSWIRLTAVDSSSQMRRGTASGAWDVHPTLDPWSRRVAPISSGSGTEARGGNGPTPPEPADSAKGAALLRRNRGDDAA